MKEYHPTFLEVKDQLTALNHILKCANQETGRGVGTLDILAAYTKLSESVLRDISCGKVVIDTATATAVCAHIKHINGT